MSVLFIANVGNRDVQVPGDFDLPPEKDARARGQALLDNWEIYRKQVQADILIKALRWVVRKHDTVEQVVLIASDQSDERYRQSDTISLAHVLERLLTERPAKYDWAKQIAEITIVPVNANPASYDDMTAFYEHLLPRLSAAHGDIVYLAVSGGTAAMASMLLFKGIEHFQTQAHPLYVNEHDAMPTSLNVGRQIMLNSLASDIQSGIEIYEYHAALRLVDENAGFLQQALPHFSTLRAVVNYARARLNFDFTAAEKALFGMDLAASSEHTRAIHHLVNDITEQNRSEDWLLREVLYTAEISFNTGAYADFLGRAFRLSEGLTDYIVDRWAPGEVFELKQEKNRDGTTRTRKVVAERWLDENVSAWEFLDQKGIELEQGVTRRTLLALADYFAGNNNTRQQIVKRLNRIGELGSYRNLMPFAHGYEGVSLDLLKERYQTNRDDEILRDLKRLYEQCTGQPPGPNPYDAINALILDLIQAAP